MMKVLITHADGFLGFHLTRRLAAEGHSPLAALGSGATDSWGSARAAELGSLPHTRQPAVDALAAFAPEVVVYLGLLAQDADPSAAEAGARLAELGALLDEARARGVKHLVLGSGAAVYGATEKLPFGVAQPLDRPLSMEGAAQRAGELLAWSFSNLHRLPITALRFFSVYGPWGRPEQAALRFLRAARSGGEVALHGGGQQRRDFTFVDDAVEVLVRAVERAPEAVEPAPPYAAFNVGTGTPTPVSRLLEVAAQVAGRELATRAAPAPDGALPHTWADVRDLQHAYGFRPRTSLAEGLRATWEWLERGGPPGR